MPVKIIFENEIIDKKSKENINFTSEEIKLLEVFIEKLKQIPIFEVTEILDLLESFQNKTKAIENWKKEIEQAVFSGNEELVKQLCNLNK